MAKSGTASRVSEKGARSNETRRLLVDAAIATLRQEGFVGASARAIAERAGSQPGPDLLPLRHGGQSVVGRTRCRQR